MAARRASEGMGAIAAIPLARRLLFHRVQMTRHDTSTARLAAAAMGPARLLLSVLRSNVQPGCATIQPPSPRPITLWNWIAELQNRVSETQTQLWPIERKPRHASGMASNQTLTQSRAQLAVVPYRAALQPIHELRLAEIDSPLSMLIFPSKTRASAASLWTIRGHSPGQLADRLP